MTPIDGTETTEPETLPVPEDDREGPAHDTAKDATLGRDAVERLATRHFYLDGAAYPLKRLGTRDGLTVAKIILGYLSKMEDIFEEGSALQGLEGSEAIAAGLKFVDKLVPLLKEDDLVDLASRILGVDGEIVGAAPIEDTLNAVADAFEVNDMPALLKAAQRIWTNLQKFGVGK